jgi:AcrR family transcriptional regulator
MSSGDAASLDKSFSLQYHICMSDQTTTKQKRTWTRQADNRANLIAAGYAILSEKGFEATTVKEIASLANVSPGLFHYYFASKNDLLLALIYEAGARFSQQLMLEMEKMSSEHAFPDMAMLAVAAASRSNPEWYRLRYELYALGLRNPDFLPAVGEMLAKGRQGIAQVIQEQTGIDTAQAQAIAAIWHACTDGLALQQLTQPGLDLTASYQLVQRLLNAEPSPEK